MTAPAPANVADQAYLDEFYTALDAAYEPGTSAATEATEAAPVEPMELPPPLATSSTRDDILQALQTRNTIIAPPTPPYADWIVRIFQGATDVYPRRCLVCHESIPFMPALTQDFAGENTIYCNQHLSAIYGCVETQWRAGDLGALYNLTGAVDHTVIQAAFPMREDVDWGFTTFGQTMFYDIFLAHLDALIAAGSAGSIQLIKTQVAMLHYFNGLAAVPSVDTNGRILSSLQSLDASSATALFQMGEAYIARKRAFFPTTSWFDFVMKKLGLANQVTLGKYEVAVMHRGTYLDGDPLVGNKAVNYGDPTVFATSSNTALFKYNKQPGNRPTSLDLPNQSASVGLCGKPKVYTIR